MKSVINGFLFSGFALYLICLPACNQEMGGEIDMFEEPTSGVEFRDGVTVLPTPDTSVDLELLAARDRNTTTLLDPTGAVWELTTAEGMEQGDFREADFTPSLNTEPAFYHRRVEFPDNKDMEPECAVFIEAGAWQFAVLRRGEDQGPCPTTEEYIAWLPNARVKDTNLGESSRYTEKHAALSFGAYTGTFNGVNSYSNYYPKYYCPYFKPWSTCTSYVGNELAGIKWQCVEYTDRYYLSVYNHKNLWKGHAKYWYAKAAQYGLKSYPNCGSTLPKIGDMLVSASGPYGHIAIVRSVGLMSVTVIQQNWFENAKDNYTVLPLSRYNGKFCVGGFSGSYPVTGWIRK